MFFCCTSGIICSQYCRKLHAVTDQSQNRVKELGSLFIFLLHCFASVIELGCTVTFYIYSAKVIYCCIFFSGLQVVTAVSGRVVVSVHC